MDFVSYTADLEPMNAMRRISLVMMHGVFVLLVVRQLVTFLRDGRGDFFLPLLHYCIGLVLILSLPEVGKTLVKLSRDISEQVYADQNVTTWLASETKYYSESDESPLASLAQFLNGKTYLRFVARTMVYLMLVFKIVLIDIIWQVFFLLATLLGGLTIPIALMFGGNALTSWFKGLVELMLWPIIYSFLMLLTNSVMMGDQGMMVTYEYLEGDLKRICACLVIFLLTGLTPLLARAVMRTELSSNAAEEGKKLVMVVLSRGTGLLAGRVSRIARARK